MAPPHSPRSWARDPVVFGAAIVAVAAHAWMLFVGRYLPFIDWSNHLGLIAILADGGDTGALAYADRSFAPTPYWLFYMVTAAFAQVVAVEAAAKLTFLAATAALVFATAFLAETTGRDPRLAAIAPLAMFSVALGYGFASWVCGLWSLPFLLGAAERAITAETRSRRDVALLAVAWAACFLSHALLFTFGSIAIATRVAIDLSRRGRRDAGPRLATVALAAAPTALLGLYTLARLDPRAPLTERWAHFEVAPWSLTRLASDLLQRGDDRHVYTMIAAAAWWLAALLVAWRRGKRSPKRSAQVGDADRRGEATGFAGAGPPGQRSAQVGDADRRGEATGFAGAGPPGTLVLVTYATLGAALYAFGPMTLERPVEVWMLAPRFAAIAALFVFLLPTTRLRGPSIAFVGVALALVVANAALDRAMIAKFDRIGRRYDPVRRHIPRGATYLALTLVPPGDLATYHPAVQSLFFHHLCDGAAYSAYLFDNPLHPVRPKKARLPAPPWRDVASYDPNVHGVAYDYLVLRGALLVERTKQAGTHDLVAEENGWFVFATKR